MEKKTPLWQRIYQEPAFAEIARIVGYSGTTYRDLMEKVEPLKKRFGGQTIDSAIFSLATFEGDTTCNVKPLALVSLRAEAKKLCWQLLGVHPDHIPVDMYAEIMASGERLKADPKVAKKPSEKKPRKRNTPSETPAPTLVTPTMCRLMEQYREAKERHPRMLLLFRIGDFYELFEEDAKTAAKVLGLTLTTRDRTHTMAGFPRHALGTYLQKLLKAGQSVAICDQVKESLPKVPIWREVTCTEAEHRE